MGKVAPLFHLPHDDLSESVLPPVTLCKTLVAALIHSGFLRILTPLVPIMLQERALQAATSYLDSPTDSKLVTRHPTDPKSYAMLTSRDDFLAVLPVFLEYCSALEATKAVLLRCLAIGLDLHPSYFTRLHAERNNNLRLLRYPQVSRSTGVLQTNRKNLFHSHLLVCKPLLPRSKTLSSHRSGRLRHRDDDDEDDDDDADDDDDDDEKILGISRT